MKVKLDQIKTAGVQTGMAVAGFVGGHVANQFAPEQFKKFVPYGELAAGLALAAMSKNEAVQAFGVGLASHGAIKTVNNLTAPSADGTPATGIKAMIGQYVPTLSGLEDASWGMGYIGEYPEYYEETPLLMGTMEELPSENAEWM